MIHLEIISSSDPLALGLYEFEYDYLLIGRSKKNDLIFLDKEIPLRYMLFQIINEHLVARSLTRSPYFFINGKKVSGSLKIRTGDIVAFGENQIKIVKYARAKNKSDHEDLGVIYDEFKKNAPELEFALNFIEDVLIDLEKKAPHV